MREPLETSSDKNEIERMRRESAERELRGAIEQIIDDAQKKGVFDNLPGKGKPLNLGKNRQAGERALAFDLLQNNDYTLPWIAARQETLETVEAFRAELEESWQVFLWQLDKAVGASERQAARHSWQQEKMRLAARLREINQAIAALNLTIPVERLEVLKLQWQKELLRVGVQE